jgi:sugar lactone lactonase YvrE
VYCKDGRGSDGAAAFSRVLTMPASAAKSAAAESDHRPFRQPPPQRTEAIKLGSHMDGEWVVTAVDGAGRESTCSNAVRVPLIVLAHGLALAPDGTVFLSDAHPHTGMIVALPNGMAGPDWMFMPGAGGDGRMLGLAVHAKPSPAMPFRIVAVNTYAHLLHFFDPQGRYLKHVGDRAGSGPGQFSAPSGVAVGPDGRCYVTDTGNRRVQVFGPDGKFLGQFGAGDGGQAGDLGALQEPVGIALDTRGQVYVVDQKAGRVVVFRDGKPFRAFGAGDLRAPRWIALRNDGVVCVSQPSRREIAIFDAAGAKIGVYTGPDPEHPLGRVQGIAFDRRGTLWIAAEDFGACLHRFEVPRRPGK